MPDFAAYQARILSYIAGKDPLTMQREMPNLLADLVAGVPLDKVSARPAPGKWSIGEIVAHLSETEWAASWRYRQMIEHPGAALPGYDQDLWERLGGLQFAATGRFPAYVPTAARRQPAHVRAAHAGTMGVARSPRRTRPHDRPHSHGADGGARSQSRGAGTANPGSAEISRSYLINGFGEGTASEPALSEAEGCHSGPPKNGGFSL